MVQNRKLSNLSSSSRRTSFKYSGKISANTKPITFRKGDWYIPLNQTANRFLIETLEPQGEDSYFAWNFFDPILGQKEGCSDYAFEDIAGEFKKNNPDAKQNWIKKE
jgi:hypothetical protein